MNDLSTALAFPSPLLSRTVLGAGTADAVDPERVLGTVGFGFTPPRYANAAPAVHVAVGRLPGSEPVYETWLAGSRASVGLHGPVEFATDGDLLFGCVQMEETAAGGLRSTAQAAFTAIFAALDHAGRMYPLRIWNYVPRINVVTDGLERYRQFNIGRQDAFLAAGRAAFAGAPAACAIGTVDGPLAIHFLASRRAPSPVENPRQVSAYHYPLDYGPRSPTFSRAAIAGMKHPTLFVSGTASIVGHRSLHVGDAGAQTAETFANLRTLLAAANASLGAPAFSLARLAYTVYVRNARDLDVVRGELARALGESVPAVPRVALVQADICRAELLVEIEATSDVPPSLA